MSRAGRYAGRVAALADTFEILHSLMEKWEDGHLPLVRSLLEGYQSKFEGKVFDYVSILDMSNRKFDEVYSFW